MLKRRLLSPTKRQANIQIRKNTKKNTKSIILYESFNDDDEDDEQ